MYLRKDVCVSLCCCQVIERLERLVRTLNQEKDQYRRHIRDLQSECGRKPFCLLVKMKMTLCFSIVQQGCKWSSVCQDCSTLTLGGFQHEDTLLGYTLSCFDFVCLFIYFDCHVKVWVSDEKTRVTFLWLGSLLY